MIKNFSFLLSVKTWFEPIVFPGSLAVLIGAAPPLIISSFSLTANSLELGNKLLFALES